MTQYLPGDTMYDTVSARRHSVRYSICQETQCMIQCLPGMGSVSYAMPGELLGPEDKTLGISIAQCVRMLGTSAVLKVHALHCTLREVIAVLYSAVQCSTVQCSAVQYSAVHCGAVQCSAVHYSEVDCSAVQCQCSTVPVQVYPSLVKCSAMQCLGAGVPIARRYRPMTES